MRWPSKRCRCRSSDQHVGRSGGPYPGCPYYRRRHSPPCRLISKTVKQTTLLNAPFCKRGYDDCFDECLAFFLHVWLFLVLTDVQFACCQTCALPSASLRTSCLLSMLRSFRSAAWFLLSKAVVQPLRAFFGAAARVCKRKRERVKRCLELSERGV